MRYYRTTGLILTQMQELVRRVKEELREPWNKPTGRPKSLGLYQAVEVTCMYLRQNATQEFIGDMRGYVAAHHFPLRGRTGAYRESGARRIRAVS